MVKMKNTFLTLILTACAVSCGLSETGHSSRPSGQEIWKNPAFSPDSSSYARKRCYVTGLDYPDGYDWRADPENGTVKCSLVVFVDGIPAMKIPVGHEYHVSPDPDMHRVIEGHLYTDYSTEEETVIKKDGKEVFRYPGREMIIGMEVLEGDIYTLGQPRNGDGFAYRRNGTALIQRGTGYAFPRLQQVDGSICFAFSEPIESLDEILERYYHVMDGEVSQVAVREDVKKVWDVLMHDGEVCWSGTLTGVSAPVIASGGKMTAIEFSKGVNLLTSRLVSAGKSIGMEAICSDGLSYSSGLWKDAAKYMSFSKEMTINGLCTWDDGICCVLNSGSLTGGGTIFRCGEIFEIPAGYTVMGSSPIAMKDGILHVGLSSLNKGKPVIWKDDTRQEIDINGFICTLSVH